MNIQIICEDTIRIYSNVSSVIHKVEAGKATIYYFVGEILKTEKILNVIEVKII